MDQSEDEEPEIEEWRSYEINFDKRYNERRTGADNKEFA